MTLHQDCLKSRLAVVAFFICSAGQAQLIVPLGQDLQVNETWYGGQERSAVAAAGDRFLVVWTGPSPESGAGAEIFGRLFDERGMLGGEFQISNQGDATADYAQVVGCPDGSFAVAWLAMPGGPPNGIWARAFTAQGEPISEPFPASPQGDQLLEYFALACDRNTDLLVGWNSPFAPPWPNRNVAQKFTTHGSALTTIEPLDEGSFNTHGVAEILTFPDGSFEAIWQVYAPPDARTTVFRRFSSPGSPLANEVLLPTFDQACWVTDALLGNEDTTTVAMDCHYPGSLPFQVRLATFDDSDGALQADFVSEHSPGTGTQRPRIADSGRGRALAFWERLSVSDETVPRLSHFDTDLVPFQLDVSARENPESSGYDGDVAVSENGVGLAVWTTYGEDGSVVGVFARRFLISSSAPEIPALSSTGVAFLAITLGLCGLFQSRRTPSGGTSRRVDPTKRGAS